MNAKTLILLILFTTSFRLNTSIGCMDNSYHMQQKGDTKEFHYVYCSCPCKNVISKRGKCIRCGHFGRPDRGEINALQLYPQVLR